MEYDNGLIYIKINNKVKLNNKNSAYIQKKVKEYAEELADFIEMCREMQSSDEYMNETPLGHKLEGE